MLLHGGLSKKEQLSVNISISLSIFMYMYSVQNFAQITAFTPASPPLITASLQSACCSGTSQRSVHETDFSVFTQYTQCRQKLQQYPLSVVSPISGRSTLPAFHL